MKRKREIWHKEPVWPGREIKFKMKKKWLLDEVECFPDLGNIKQKVQIGDFEGFGKTLVIDGITQMSEKSDKVYTDALIYPALFASSSPRKWFIAGGGDGAAAKEILYVKDVEAVKLADISKTVVKQTQKLIPSFWENCQKDKRLKIVMKDAFKEAEMGEKKGEKFDVVVSDLTDSPNIEYTTFLESTADHIYTEKGLHNFYDILNAHGIFVIQAQELSDFSYQEHKRILKMIKKIFPPESVYSYRTFVELSGCWQSYIIASKAKKWNPLRCYLLNKKNISLMKQIGIKKEYYSGWINYIKSLFAIPPEISEKII